MSLEYAILGFLEREPMTGYDLKTRCFDDAASHLWAADQAQVYRTLERLSGQGLTRSRVFPQRGRPDRRIHRITPKGREALYAWLHRAQGLAPVRDPFLVRVALSEGLPDGDIAEILSQARVDYQSRLDTLRADAAAPVPPCAAQDERSSELYRMTLGAAISTTRSVIDWIDDAMERIARGLPEAHRPTSEGV